MNVLLIEDDNAIAGAVELLVRSHSWVPLRADNGEDGMAMARDYAPDVVITDLGLPDVSGIDVVKKIAIMRTAPPILVLSGCGELEIKLAALRAGAADFMLKPFHGEELYARILSILRRSQGRASNIVELGRLTVDLGAQLTFVDGKPVKVPRGQNAVLMHLAANAGKFVTREELEKAVYDPERTVDSSLVRTLTSDLRQRLSNASHGVDFIDHEHGRGYRLFRGRTPAPPDDGPDWFERLGLDSSVTRRETVR